MTTPDPTLIVALSDPAVASLSDADALTAINTPCYTPRPYRVDYTWMGSIWGGQRAAQFHATIEAAAASIPASAMTAFAGYVDTLLSGPGIAPTDPQTVANSAAIVSAGLATADEVTALLNTVSYPGGTVRVLADVTAARAWIVRQTAANATLTALETYSSAVRTAANAYAAGAVDTLPTVPGAL